ncbi:MAG: YaeQ family protein, partial [Desulfuromonadales bacterium]|nr:YaeQ family protein [Desulfuromonadales bacterium]
FWRWQEAILPKLAVIDNLTILALEPAFVAQIVARLQRAISWSLTITEGNIYLTIGTDTLESQILFLQGER